MRELFQFPNPVNEKAARVVAGGVFLTALVVLATGALPLLALLAVGFVLRVLTGPRLSPLGLLATRVIAPRLGAPRLVPGPPKRFAQGIGAVLTIAATVAALVLGWSGVATALTVALVLASGLEALAGYCLGCKVFGLLMRAGVVPDSVCAECSDWSRARVGV